MSYHGNQGQIGPLEKREDVESLHAIELRYGYQPFPFVLTTTFNPLLLPLKERTLKCGCGRGCGKLRRSAVRS